MFLLVWLQSLRIKQSVCRRQSENFQLSLDFFSFVRGCEDKSHSSLKFAHMLERKNILNRKYRKNCGCCPVSLFIVRSLWLSCFEVLKTEGRSRNDCFYCLCLRISRNFESSHLTMFDCWALAKSLWHLFWSKVWFSKLGKTLLSIIAAVLHRKMRKTFYAK